MNTPIRSEQRSRVPLVKLPTSPVKLGNVIVGGFQGCGEGCGVHNIVEGTPQYHVELQPADGSGLWALGSGLWPLGGALPSCSCCTPTQECVFHLRGKQPNALTRRTAQRLPPTSRTGWTPPKTGTQGWQQTAELQLTKTCRRGGPRRQRPAPAHAQIWSEAHRCRHTHGSFQRLLHRRT